MVLLFLATSTSIRTEKYILTVSICCLGLLDTGPLLMFLHAMMISALLFPPAFSTCVKSSPNPYRDAQGLDLAWSADCGFRYPSRVDDRRIVL